MSEDVGSAVAKRLNDVGPSVAVALENWKGLEP